MQVEIRSGNTRVRFLVAIAWLIGLAAHCAVAVEPAFPFLLDEKVPVSRDREVAIAKSINQECARILALIPRLSPAEDAWLQGEIQAKRDLTNLMRRPEYMRNAMFVFFSDCVNETERVVEATRARERAAAWARFASRLSWAELGYWGEHAGVPALEKGVSEFLCLRLG